MSLLEELFLCFIVKSIKLDSFHPGEGGNVSFLELTPFLNMDLPPITVVLLQWLTEYLNYQLGIQYSEVSAGGYSAR